MMGNKVSAVLEQTVTEEILAGITNIKNKLPFLIGLSTEEKKTLPKFGDKSVAFVKKAHEFASQNEGILPRSFNLDEMAKDVNLYDKLYAIQQPLRALLESIDDTLQEVGAEAYSSALYIYSLAKMHKTSVDMADETLDDLAKRFLKKSVASSEDDESTEQSG